jgi:hypothetical protein
VLANGRWALARLFVLAIHHHLDMMMGRCVCMISRLAGLDVSVILAGVLLSFLAFCNERTLLVVDSTPYFSLGLTRACTKYMHVRH